MMISSFSDLIDLSERWYFNIHAHLVEVNYIHMQIIYLAHFINTRFVPHIRDMWNQAKFYITHIILHIWEG